MDKTLCALGVTVGVLVLAAVSSGPSPAQTVQGDILRGQGRFLEGAGWYNLNTARAGRINVESWKSYNREIQRLYRDYMMDRYKHMQYRKELTNKVQAEIQRKFEQDQYRWRTDPTPADIASGDALNALADDLADPSIDPSSWRVSKVELPPAFSLTALTYKIADLQRSKLQRSSVAIDHMLIKDRWPLPFRRPEIEPECTAYEKAVTEVVNKCKSGTPIDGKDYDQLRNAVETLRQKVETAVPTRDNQRSSARDFVRSLDDATRIFAEQTYAEPLIRDVSEHRATTVAELLAFMREYRLLFAESSGSPEASQLYNELYGLLRRQKQAFGLRDSAPTAPSDIFKVGTVWSNNDNARPVRLRVIERDGPRFKAVLFLGQNVVRGVSGKLGDTTIDWLARDMHVVKGKAEMKGANAHGTFDGEKIQMEFNAGGRRSSTVFSKVN